MKKVLTTLLTFIIATSGFSCLSFASTEELTIVLDPGHGDTSFGCTCEYDGEIIKEEILNFKIASFIKQELEKYQTKDGYKVNVYLTRTETGECPSLLSRIEQGVNKNADMVISLHNNAHTNKSQKIKGCMVLVTSTKFNDFYQIEEDLALCILSELQKVGLSVVPDIASKGLMLYNASNIENPEYRHCFEVKNGLLRRLSGDGSIYPNGDITDWYGIIMHGINEKVPSILIEHAYLDNEEDYRNFLSSEDKLQNLAIADVKGIVKYYGLVEKN